MKKNSFVSSNTSITIMVSGFLCFLLLNSCGKENQVPASLMDTTAAQSDLNPLSKGEQLNPISKGEQLNPVSKGEQLNPISKGEQLNPGSKGERIVAGELLLLGANRLIPHYALRFFLDGKPLPTDWLRLSSQDEQTLRYQIENMPTENIHILEVRYLGETLSTMVLPEVSLLNLNLRSSFVVDTVRFADTNDIIGLADWTPELLQALMTRAEIDALLGDFRNENAEQTPAKLNQWITQDGVQQELRTLLSSLK